MKTDQIVNDYRALLKSVPDKVAQIEHPELRDMGLEDKAQGMVQIYQRIEYLPTEEVWQQASRFGTPLQTRVNVMREVDELLGQFVARPMPSDWSSVRGKLAGLVGGLPGGGPTQF